MGFLFQHAALYDSLTVEENIAFPLKRHTKMTESERGDRVKELLASVGMEGDLKKMPSELSGGMQKRVGLGARSGSRARRPLARRTHRGARSHHLRRDQ